MHEITQDVLICVRIDQLATNEMILTIITCRVSYSDLSKVFPLFTDLYFKSFSDPLLKTIYEPSIYFVSWHINPCGLFNAKSILVKEQ